MRNNWVCFTVKWGRIEVLTWVSWNQNQSYHSDQSQQTQTIHEPIRNRGKYRQTALSAGKYLRASNTWFCGRLIGWESGATCFSQSQSVAVQYQSNSEITFNTQLKTTLLDIEKQFTDEFTPSIFTTLSLYIFFADQQVFETNSSDWS